MNAVSPPTPETTDSSRERLERHGRVLAELAGIGLALARAVEAQVSADASIPTEARFADPAVAFERIARAVRQTLALETALADEAGRRALAEAAEQARVEAAQRAETAARTKAKAERIVREIAGAEAERIDAERLAAGRPKRDRGDTEHLLLDLYERLEDDFADPDFAGKSVAEIIAGVCRDLGIQPDWTRWGGDDWVQELMTIPVPDRVPRDGVPLDDPPPVINPGPPRPRPIRLRSKNMTRYPSSLMGYGLPR